MRMGSAPRASRAGYTVVELMIVLMVTAALAVVGFASFASASDGEVGTRLRSDLTQVSLRAEAQFERTQKYPTTATGYAATQAAYPGLVVTRNSQWALTNVTADQRGATVQVKDVNTGRTCTIGVGSLAPSAALTCT